jgi:hypothetical protein
MSLTYISVEMRRLIQERARDRCEYCLIPAAFALLSHEIDHIVAEKHGGETIDSNLALSCALCNQHKGTDLTSIDPVTGNIEPLLHPRKDRWSDHFQFSKGRIEPLTSVGRVTVRLLQFNVPERISERLVLSQSGNLGPA